MTSTPFAAQRGHLQRVVLANGATLLLGQNPTVDILAAHCFFRGGSRVERPEQAGLTNLMAAVLTKGTQQRDSQAIAAWVESLGAALSIDSAADYFEVSLRCVSADFPELLGLLSEILQAPTFPEAEVDREQALMLQSIRAQQERPFSLAFDQVRQALYGDHPYALPGVGRLETVGSLCREDLVAHHATYCRPDQMVMVVIGPESIQQMAAHIEAALSDWVAPPRAGLDPALSLSPLEHPKLLRLPQPTQQTTMMIGFQGSAAGSADYAALKLLCTYLGNGLSSRLFVELRERCGLAYEVSAFFATRREPAPFVTYMGTASENTAMALDRLQAEIQRLHAHPLSPAEVEMAQRKLLGQYALSKQTNAQVAQLAGWYEILGLGMEFDQRYLQMVRHLTPEYLLQAVQTYLVTPVIALVGPDQALEQVELVL
ncbi:insulinase family protein [Synechococcus sp. Nb3U1]|uniref:M16 family metallopeptidase n=1 Tax=Synechococcus sp. Nb3U1 TaxID=1914529 RepID=UPI001F210E04|nr:pitrilysin family protein [Synechococcus sp. Nb3U1]MCF2970259.1 insulinase family protein [Synechococcus sp. Nb3U1]